MSNEITNRINDVKCEIKKLENELRELERANVHFYAVVIQSRDNDAICVYGQLSSGVISEADAKKLILNDYCDSSYTHGYNIGYIPVSKEVYQKIGDLVLLKATRRNINRCQKKDFRDFENLDIVDQQLDKIIENLNHEVNSKINISDATFIDFDD